MSAEMVYGRFHSLTTAKAAEHAGADVVKQSESPLMSSMLYPGLQALDEQHLDVHFQFGGADQVSLCVTTGSWQLISLDLQRKIFMYAAHFLPRMGYAKRAHLMSPMVPGLSGGKMSSSEPRSKIDFLDTPAEVKNKLKAALCTPGEVEGNGVFAFLKHVLIPVQQLRIEQAQARGQDDAMQGEGSFVKTGAPKGTIFTISRPQKFGGDIHFASYKAIEDAYAQEQLHPGDLKGGVTDAINGLLAPIQKMFEADPDWQEVERLGYPDASTASAMASAKQGAGNKTQPVKAVRDFRCNYTRTLSLVEIQQRRPAGATD